MTDGQGKDRRSMAGETPRSMRGAHLPQPDRSASLSPSSWLPAPHQGLADNLVRAFGSLFEPVGHDGPRDAAGMHVAQAARAFGTAAKQRAPAGAPATGQSFVCQPGRRGRCVPTAPASQLRWSSPAGASTGIAMRIATARPDATASVRVPGCRRQDGPTVGLPCWLSPSRRSPPMPTSPARPGSPTRHRRRRLLPRSPVQPAEMAAFRAA